jgi:putative inorganic carbon (HCO3(-)) transporter
MRAWLSWAADWQVLLVGLIVPVYVFFSDQLAPGVLALLLLTIPFLWLLHWLARGRPFTPTPLDLPLLVWLATLPAGLWAASPWETSLPILFREIVAIALFYAVVNSLNSAGRLKLATAGLIVGTALLAGVGLLGTRGLGRLPLSLGRLVELVPGRALSFWNSESIGFNPNLTGGILALFTPVTVAYALAASWPMRLRNGVAAVVLWLLAAGEILVLILTRSRGAILGFVVGLAVLVMGRNRRWAWLLPVAGLAVAIALAVWGIQPMVDLVVGGTADSAVSSVEARTELISRGLYMMQDFPFTGVGLGMFSRVLPILYPLFLDDPNPEATHVHNVYLQTGIDHGLPGLIAFVAMLFLLAAMGSQAIRLSRRQPWEPLAIGLLAGLAAYSVHGFVDVVASSPRAQILIWTHWGVLAGVWRWAQAHRATTGE